MGPNKNSIFPNGNLKSMCYIKNVVKAPNIFIGDYTYYDDTVDSTKFEQNNVLFNWVEFGDKLIIGKFCAIAMGTQFLMGAANHRMGSVTTYPFNVFGGGWEKSTPHLTELPFKGDTVIGNDVWFGRDCFIMAGVKIGDGAIIAAKTVVTKDVAPYTIVGGNPAKIIKKRFDDELTEYLLNLKWWDWSENKIFENLPALTSGDLSLIKKIK